MNPQFVRVAITMSDTSLAVMSFMIHGRGPVLPPGAVWVNPVTGEWFRDSSPEQIAAEIARTFPGVDLKGNPQPKALSWRVIPERDVPTDRDYRDACEDVSGKIVHNMAKARECCRNLLRHERAGKWPELDGKWMRAAGQGKKAEQDAAEAERQKWRDVPADPRIDAAQSVAELKQIKVG